MEFYRSGGRGEKEQSGRKPVGIVFMMTHSILDDLLVGDYKTRVQEYRDKKEPLMTECREKVGHARRLIDYSQCLRIRLRNQIDITSHALERPQDTLPIGSVRRISVRSYVRHPVLNLYRT